MNTTTTHPPTVAQLLGRLNALRADIGQDPLKAWKDSRAKLEAAITVAKDKAQVTLDAKIAEADMSSPKRAVATAVAAGDKSKAPTPGVKKKEGNGAIFTLADIARERKVSPKVIRAKARRKVTELKTHFAATGSKWTFPNSVKAKVIAILFSEATKS